MLNRKMFDDPKDAEIARLKMTIEKFKEYDKERKAYYADKMRKLGELESYMQEIESGGTGSLIATLRKQVSRLSKEIIVRGIEETRTDDELSEIISRDSLRRENKSLREKLRMMRKRINEPINEEI